MTNQRVERFYDLHFPRGAQYHGLSLGYSGQAQEHLVPGQGSRTLTPGDLSFNTSLCPGTSFTAQLSEKSLM